MFYESVSLWLKYVSGILSLLSLVSIILYIFIFRFVNTCFSRDKLIFLETFIFIFRSASYRYDIIKFV